ncbi:hypothetical protein [Pedobacter helvus]|uniref:Uncharacterized protein n=1 Tax=Pedobacter helvus TaxID=2563444 RepID=A0ABW9JF24_9SPHI|nr:hypothetical protein [Pedobacter ureilyticus]
MIDLLSNERLVASIDNDKVLLTNQRLQLVSGGNFRIINLNQISFIEVEIKYNYVTLVAAVIFLIGGFIMDGQEGGIVGIVLFLILMVLHLFLPTKNMLVRSSGGTISHRVNGIRNADVHRFIFLVQEQMNRAK